MRLKRIFTGIIGFPIVMLIIAFGSKYIIDVIISIISVIAMNEYIKCVSKKVKPIVWISYLCAACTGFFGLIPSEYMYIVRQLGIPLLLTILFLHVIVSNMKISYEDIVYTLMGIMYICVFLSFFPIIYAHEGNISGKILVCYLIFSSWGTDTFAYFIGCKIGKTKFSKVSPKKSVEGCIAGIFGAIFFSVGFTLILNLCFAYTISYLRIIFISIVLSILSQVGDFSASVIKRSFDVKDFSELFPGHGGMLDRIDSLMFIAPFAYFLLTTCL